MFCDDAIVAAIVAIIPTATIPHPDTAVKDLDALKGQDVRGGQAAATLTSSVIKRKEETAVATISNIR